MGSTLRDTNFKVGDRVRSTKEFWPGCTKQELVVISIEDVGNPFSLNIQWLGFICPLYDGSEDVKNGEPNFGSSCFELITKNKTNFIKRNTNIRS